MKQILIDFITLAVLYLAIEGLWVMLELSCYGEVQPRAVDDVIGTILWISLYFNVRKHIKQTEATT